MGFGSCSGAYRARHRKTLSTVLLSLIHGWDYGACYGYGVLKSAFFLFVKLGAFEFWRAFLCDIPSEWVLGYTTAIVDVLNMSTS